ncbi:MAG: hypothetical protein RMZ41_001745 [Nostoc sp. DedVER02]|uniref:hypothetical protein n=1 Tax=unclassified Nostoc TaxID=2593658 RepID=UPI002AD48E6D|nr:MULTISPECIES: hypothetical protein [unclassified Nostoc]MDZ7987118.1 hypothetical protein [Nostoc sp. DedVER02]MDZ8111012.1 hypothetical protein [Nostoc sp. DedVER01b]
MTQFTIPQVEEFERILGYSIYNVTVRNQLISDDYTVTIVDRALTILDELVSIDGLLKESLETSFVKESRGSKLSYSSHVAHLKSEGTRLLNELGQLLRVGVNYNKYSPNKKRNSTAAYW